MILEVYLQPSYSSTLRSMGIDEDEDYNSEAVMFQQGYDAEVIEVEDGDTFQVPDDYSARILSDDIPFRCLNEEDEEEDVFEAVYFMWASCYFVHPVSVCFSI